MTRYIQNVYAMPAVQAAAVRLGVSVQEAARRTVMALQGDPDWAELEMTNRDGFIDAVEAAFATAAEGLRA